MNQLNNLPFKHIMTEKVSSLSKKICNAFFWTTKIWKISRAALCTTLLCWFWLGINDFSKRVKKAKGEVPTGLEIQNKIAINKSLANTYFTADSVYLWKFWWRTHDYIPFEDINPTLIQAAIWTEDKRFLSHDGLDKKALLWAVKAMISGNRRGGSTLTSQVIKTTYWRDTYEWKSEFLDIKIKEFLMAQELEESFSSKDEAKKFILESYLNNFSFDNHWSWIEGAAQRMFGKSQSELSLDEAAAVLSRAVSPAKVNYKWWASNAEIHAEAAKDAVLKDISFAIKEWSFESWYPTFTLSEKELSELQDRDTYSWSDGWTQNTYWDVNNTYFMERLKIEATKFWKNNMELETTINSKIHNDFVALLSELVNSMDKKLTPLTPAKNIEIWAITTDLEGRVVSYIWGRDKKNTKVFDRVQNDAETGSIIKSIILTLAIDEGLIWSMDDTFIDKKYTLNKNEFWMNKDRTPKNYSWSFSWARLTYKEWLIRSKNSMMAWLLKKWWLPFLKKVYKYFDDHWIKYKRKINWDIPSPQVILWAWWFEMSPEDIHLLYTTFYSDSTELSSLQYIKTYKNTITWDVEEISPRVFEGNILSKKAKDEVRKSLLEKGRRETSHHYSWWLHNVLIKTWTTWFANKYWMTIMAPEFHTTIMVWYDAQSINGDLVWGNNSYLWSSSRVFREFIWNLFTKGEESWWYDPKQKLFEESNWVVKPNKIIRKPDMLKLTDEVELLGDRLFASWEDPNDSFFQDSIPENTSPYASEIEESTVSLVDTPQKVINSIWNNTKAVDNISTFMNVIVEVNALNKWEYLAIFYTDSPWFWSTSLSMTYDENVIAHRLNKKWITVHEATNRWNKKKRMQLCSNEKATGVPLDIIRSPYVLYSKDNTWKLITKTHQDLSDFVNSIESQLKE